MTRMLSTTAGPLPMRYCPTCFQVTSSEACPSDGTATREDPYVGETLDGRFKVVQPIGKGGMGTVYRALDVGLSRHVAIKVLRSARATNPDALGRFTREVKVLAALRHPNTVVLHGFGPLPNGSAYMVTELLEGETLAARLKRRGGALGLPETLTTAAAVSRSLAQAHRKGIVHRDLKPDNIFHDQVDEGLEVVKVLDFGIAKFFEKPQGDSRENSYKTAQHDLVGTPAYLSPEQIQEQELDGRADLYALGIILFQCLAGRLPFQHADPFAILAAHVEEPPPPLPAGIPEDVSRLILELLAKTPAQRPATADDVTARLEALAVAHRGAVERTLVVAHPSSANATTGAPAVTGPVAPTPLPLTPAALDGPTLAETMEHGAPPRLMRPYVQGAMVGAVVGLVVTGAFALGRAPAEPQASSPVVAAAALVPPPAPSPPPPPDGVAEEPESEVAEAVEEPAPAAGKPGRRRPPRASAVAAGLDASRPLTRSENAARLHKEASRAFAEGRFGAAEALGREALDLLPNSVDTHKLLGVVLARQGRACDAVPHYRRALQLQPNGASADRIRDILKDAPFTNCK